MAKKITGNEPALPTQQYRFIQEPGKVGSDCLILQTGGLTIRQQFAMAAMQGILANQAAYQLSDPQVAQYSVILADHLINALNEKEEAV